MGQNSKIEWTHHTFNPWRGCSKVSSGCKNCYAETLAKRNPGVLGEWGPGAKRRLASDRAWSEPLKWNADAAKSRRRARVFCGSMCDWLDDEVPTVWRKRLLELIWRTEYLDWLLLTKRPQLWARLMADVRAASIVEQRENGYPKMEIPGCVAANWLQGDSMQNIWFGVSVEDQATADSRIAEAVKIPAEIRFLSCEPLLERVWLEDPLGANKKGFSGEGIDWVICGGESGPGARPFDLSWARDLQDYCRRYDIAFFMKQMGAFPVVSGRGDGPNALGLKLVDKKGGDPSEWPEDLRVREFPVLPNAEVSAGGALNQELPAAKSRRLLH